METTDYIRIRTSFAWWFEALTWLTNHKRLWRINQAVCDWTWRNGFQTRHGDEWVTPR